MSPVMIHDLTYQILQIISSRVLNSSYTLVGKNVNCRYIEKLDKSSGGNNVKYNYTAIGWGNDHGAISFGSIHLRADVTSDMLQASDGEHFLFYG